MTFFYFVISKDAPACQGNSEIKSCAVVKYSAAPPPTSYALLQEKTDLKLPPANWLRENPQLGSAGTTILGSSSKSKPFSRYSFLKNCTLILYVHSGVFIFNKTYCELSCSFIFQNKQYIRYNTVNVTQHHCQSNR